MLRRISDSEYRYFRSPEDEEHAGVLKRNEAGAWVVEGYEKKRTFPSPEAAELAMGVFSAFDYMPWLLRDEVPPLYYHDMKEEPMVARIKLFAPWTFWTWYICEASLINGGEPRSVSESLWSMDSLRLGHQDVECFGYLVGAHPEYGSFTLAQLAQVRGPLGMRIERDLHFTPTPMSELVV